MPSLKNTKILKTWSIPDQTSILRVNGQKEYGYKKVAQVREGKRGQKYFCLFIWSTVPGKDGKQVFCQAERPVQELRMQTLKDSAAWVVGLAEIHKMSPAWLEEILDLIYEELNRRLNKDDNG